MRNLHVGSPVLYNDGEAQRLAFVATKHSDEVLDLIVFDDNGQSTMKTSVGRRSPEDYGPEGGGATWHYVS